MQRRQNADKWAQGEQPDRPFPFFCFENRRAQIQPLQEFKFFFLKPVALQVLLQKNLKMKRVCLRACTTLIPPSAANTPELGKQRTCQFSAPRTASVQVNTEFGFNQPCKMPMELYPPTKAICSPVAYLMMDGNGKAICFPTDLDKIPLCSRRMRGGSLNVPVVPPGHRCVPVSLCPGGAALGRGS